MSVVVMLGCCITLMGCSDQPADDPGVVGTGQGVADEETAGPDGPAGLAVDDADMADYLAQLADEAESLGIADPPEVDPIRFIRIDEYGPTLADCITDEGFPAEAEGASGIAFGEIPQAQAEAFALAQYTCAARYPVHPRYSRPFTDEQLSALYDYFVNDLVPCLEREGFGTANPPSRETFIATYSDPERAWVPYAELDVIGQAGGPEGEAAINETCPQHAPDEALYGE
ncbi:hypothetical protein E1262_25300 [Jiangella aurantiaca]|uniref:Uncharacterized protein n=1 Tax=Jiangella aurantiaca TaxID=2530373 RepID=A0A4V2YRD7_9ACTN|nr:hypothetical protein [Jiangella aurantiaca]TDD65397.1 hypothetical protein E1262_25300 [Jiangella aurantiaca]